MFVEYATRPCCCQLLATKTTSDAVHSQALRAPLVSCLALQLVDMICKMAKKGLRPSQIGVLLRDEKGVPAAAGITGSKILRILRGHGLAAEIPEDLYCLIKKAVTMRKHLERQRKDKDAKFRLILVESRIHRLARYYKVCCAALAEAPPPPTHAACVRRACGNVCNQRSLTI